MNIHDAAKSNKPFAHPDMRGAYFIVDNRLAHRDNPKDFENLDFIRKHCLNASPVGTLDSQYGEVNNMSVKDLLREDWFVVDLGAKKIKSGDRVYIIFDYETKSPTYGNLSAIYSDGRAEVHLDDETNDIFHISQLVKV